ncbi:NUDIX hydrolase [Candidatus Microgenomates bacterium]|nr:MAG: NUDIX hydrolase [Candidatus Microgenomates bacterium]
MDKIILAGCVILQNKSVLLLKRKKTGWLELPGGKVEENETPENAAKRELKEELGVDVEILKKIGKEEFNENGKAYEYIWFLAKIINEQNLKVLEKDTFESFEYLPLNKLSSTKLSPNMQNLKNFLIHASEATHPVWI